MPMIEVSEEEARLHARIEARERIRKALVAGDAVTAEREMAAYSLRADTLAIAVRAWGRERTAELGFDMSNLDEALAGGDGRQRP